MKRSPFVIVIALVLAGGGTWYGLRAATPATKSSKDKGPAAAKPGAKGMDMDYGPFLSYSVLAPRPQQNPPKHENGDPSPTWKAGELLATKGVTVKLHGGAAVLFDTDTIRYAAGWTGGFLDVSQTNLVRNQGPWPCVAAGPLAFTTADGPGVANPADGAWADPRKRNSDPRLKTGEGPLPKAWAHYKGLYRDGDRVVFAYTVGDAEVLDLPGAIDGAFTRTLRVGPTTKPLHIRLADAGVAASAKNATIKNEGEEVVAEIAPSAQGTLATIVIAPAGKPVDVSKAPTDDPAAHTKGGPARWTQTLTTTGARGPDDAAYAVDTVNLPDTKNPWNAWVKPAAMDFFKDGRLAVSTFNGDVWIVSGLDDALAHVTWKRFATGLYEPLGLKIVDETIYVLGRDQVTRLHDLNHDGEADFYENFNNDLVSDANYHSFHCELQTDAEGNFYYTVAGNQMPRANTDSACVVRVSKYGDKAEVLAYGLRAANGMGAGPHGEITVADNQGHWVPASPIFLVKPGAFFGYHGDQRRFSKADFAEHIKQHPKTDPPLCWVPYTWDNSAGGQVWPGDRFGPLGGHMLHLSYGKCTMMEVMLDPSPIEPSGSAAGPVQGAVTTLPLKFNSGVMRGRVNPADGSVWVCGLRGWQTAAGQDGCLHRVRYTGKPFYQPVETHVTPTGLRLTFAVPLDPETANDDGSYEFEAWQYQSTEAYGSPDYKISDPKSKGHDPFDVKKAKLSPDGKSVDLEIEGIKRVQQYVLKMNLKAVDGAKIKCDVGGTINVVPHP